MRWLKAAGWAGLAGLVAAGIILNIPNASDAAAVVVGAVAAVVTFGALVFRARAEAKALRAGSYYHLLDDRFKEGLACLDAGHTMRAMGFFERAVEREPGSADAYFGRGLVCHEVEQYQEAIHDFDRAIELDPEHPYAHYQRGFVYHQLEQHEQAVADFQRAIEIRPDEWVYMLRAGAYNSLGQEEQARVDYERASQLSSG